MIVKKAFEALKKYFKHVSLLKHFNQLFKIMIETDVLKFVIFVILFQLNKKNETMILHCVFVEKNDFDET